MKTAQFVGLFFLIGFLTSQIARAEFQAGAAVVDVTPIELPVLVNGGMTSRSVDIIKTPLNARALVLDDGKLRLAIVVVDSCMMSRPFLDEAKQLASQRTKIRPDRMLISATHTHSAAASMSCLGTDADPTYVPYLREKLAEAIAAAESNLQPAKVGWAVENAAEFTALRRWICRPDRMVNDPFGNRTVRANMHAGRNWDDVTGESGPEDPDLSLISIQSRGGRPLAVLANYSMHYFSGEQGLSADYFGLFCEGMQARLAKKDDDKRSFVAMMSHGCSGDIWRRDYKVQPPAGAAEVKIDEYAAGLLEIAMKAYASVDYQSDVDLAMAESRLNLKYRVPDQQRLEWAKRVVAEMGDRLPKTTEEVYAREQIILHDRQSTEIVVQALRIGDIVIATTPTETYALTGIKLKLQSPFVKTMVIELANGGDGYIPPPEQHFLGGYNTWPARSAGLEVQAEPKIVEAALGLMERVTKQPRREVRQSCGPLTKNILAANPAAYWRMDAMAGASVVDSSGNNRDATLEQGVALFLEGPHSEAVCQDGEVNRATHFAGGRMLARVGNLQNRYSVSLWFWNGMPNDAREVSGWIFSRGRDGGLGQHDDHIGIGGTSSEPGKLVFLHGDASESAVGKSVIGRWTWNHLGFVRDDSTVRVYLNGDLEMEIESPADFPVNFDRLFFGGRCDNESNWEGRLDEIAVFDRVLSADEMGKLQARVAK